MCSKRKLDEMVHRYRELKRQIADLETELGNIETDLKSIMTEKNVDELSGADWKITWKTVISNRFDQSGFKTLYPELYESCKVPSESKRFTVK